MKRLLSLLTVTLLALAAPAFAGEPNLIGTWSGTHAASMLDGQGKGAVNVIITAQTAEAFRGIMNWKSTDGSNVGGSEQIAGVIDFDNKTVAFVQSKGGGTIWGYLKNKNTLDIVFTQASESKGQKTLAYRSTLHRVKK